MQREANGPPHYRRLSIRNFRGFKKAPEIELAPLTFLVGQNSSGKSSVFDALLLVQQSGFAPSPEFGQVPNWAGELVDLGSFKDAVHKHDLRLRIEIGFDLPASTAVRAPWREKPEGGPDHSLVRLRFRITTRREDPIGRLSSVAIEDVATSEVLSLGYTDRDVTARLLGQAHEWRPAPAQPREAFNTWLSQVVKDAVRKSRRRASTFRSAWIRIRRVVTSYGLYWLWAESQRVSSGRAAPKRWYPVAASRFHGVRFGFVPSVFDAVDPLMISESGQDEHLFPFRSRPPRIKRTLPAVLDTLDIASGIEDSRLSAYHSAIDVKDSVTGVVSKLIDVGYGASQVIPVIHACLSSAIGPLYVEQPEIHLHPKAQGTVAELLCRTSKRRQVIVETHSVHMINRARILIARRELDAADVAVLFVERTSEGSRVTRLPVLDTGDFAREWPGGFFDERYEDTMELIRLKGERAG